VRGVVSVENHVSIQLPRLEVPVYVRCPISLSSVRSLRAPGSIYRGEEPVEHSRQYSIQ
jgi:hypothetical protein